MAAAVAYETITPPAPSTADSHCYLCIPTSLKPTGHTPSAWLEPDHVPQWESITLERIRPSRNARMFLNETISVSLTTQSNSGDRRNENSFSEGEEEEEDVLPHQQEIGKVTEWIADRLGPLYAQKGINFSLTGLVWSDAKDSQRLKSVLLFFIPIHDQQNLLVYLTSYNLYSNPLAPHPATSSVLITATPCPFIPSVSLPPFPPSVWDPETEFVDATSPHNEIHRRVKNIVKVGNERGGREATPMGVRTEFKEDDMKVKERERETKNTFRCFNGNSEDE